MLKTMGTLEIGGRQYDPNDIFPVGKKTHAIGKLLHYHDLFLRGDEKGTDWAPYEPGMIFFATRTRASLHAHNQKNIDIIVDAPQLAIAFGESDIEGVPRLGIYTVEGSLSDRSERRWPDAEWGWRSHEYVHSLEAESDSVKFTEVLGVNSLYNTNGTLLQLCDIYFLGKKSRAIFDFNNVYCTKMDTSIASVRTQGIITPSGFEHFNLEYHKLVEPNDWGFLVNNPPDVRRLGASLEKDGRHVGLHIETVDISQVYYVGNTGNDPVSACARRVLQHITF